MSGQVIEVSLEKILAKLTGNAQKSHREITIVMQDIATAFAAAAGLGAAVPDATATVKGKVELATSAEAVTGTDTARAVTPAGVAAALGRAIAKGAHTVTAAEATATTLTIATGLGGNIVGAIVRVLRAGVDVTSDGVVTHATTNLTVANGAATLVLAENDVVEWLVF